VIVRALAFVIALPAIASAFSDQSQYSEPVNVGGAAGRYFTGSRVDGYACSVCHQGATTNDFTIDPLPERLEPGRRYDVVIRWRDPETPHSLHIELVTKGGAHPAVAVPMTISRESRCGQIDTGPSAIYTIDVGVRRVVGVEPCGASLVSLSFLASADPIELAVSGVRSDNSETPIGDATFERRITFNAAADSGGCSTSGGAGLLVALALLTIRSRRAR
jgi:hypothetical protein